MISDDPTNTLARTIWAEARSGGAHAMAHVASVVLNRAAKGGWWGSTIESACLAPWQFSCWNPRTIGTRPDANYQAMCAVSTEDEDFTVALDIAAHAVAGTLPDETGGADSYFALDIDPPAWTNGATHTLSDGFHSFWITRHAAHAPSAYRPQPALVSNETPTERLNAAELASVESQAAPPSLSTFRAPIVNPPQPAPAGDAGNPVEN